MFRLGSISEGTLKTEDLMEAFADVLAEFGREEDEDLLGRVRAWQGVPSDPGYEADEAILEGEILAELEQALEDAAPPYVTFGAHRGDGADFGFWPAWEAIQEDRASGELPDTDDVRGRYKGLSIDVSDHGNATLYRHFGNGHKREVWSVV